jgi:tocopherol cyclase
LTLPFGDPRRHHGAPMEGWFWRFTWPDGRVAVVLCGLCGDWALVGLATRDATGARAWTSRILDGVAASGTALRAGAAFAADPECLRLDLGPEARVAAELREGERWPYRRWGGIGPAGWLPGLAQYWHPHVLRARAAGTVAGWDLAGATAYAERNWGRGFPSRWWWGEAHDFGGDPVTVAFAGGPALGRLEATALVVAVDGRVVRRGEPLLAPVRAEVAPGSWRLRARGVEVEAAADPQDAHVLDVPVPGEHRTVPWSHQHLAGRLRVRVSRRGRTVYEGESVLAGLELGRAP